MKTGKLNEPLAATIRVRIGHTRQAIMLGATGRYDYMPLEGGKVYTSEISQRVKAIKGAVYIGGRKFGRDVLVAPVRTSDFLRINGRRYRGAIILEALRSGHLDVIEQLDLEEYLYGVLPREVGALWPEESLKAQAVMSRSYVMANRATDSQQRFDVSNDVSDQVYGGIEDEAPTSNRAVQLTRGEVLVDDEGKPVNAFFHSSCGGQTEMPTYVWRRAVNDRVFSSITDRFCSEDPYSNWKMDISAATVKAKLRKAGIRVGDIKKLKILKKSPSDRVWVFGVYGTAGSVEVQGNRFRLAIGPERLRSTYITELEKTKNGFHFEGRGWGHGVGLCQWGARGRAKAGQSYEEILHAYFPEALLSRPPGER